MKSRILIFSLAYDPFLGGAEIAIQKITDRLPETSFELITLRFDKNLPVRERVGNVTVHRIGFSKKNPSPKDLVSFPLYVNKIFFPFLAFWKAWLIHKKERVDLVWSMMSYAGFPAVFFKWFYKRIPYLLTLQEGDSIEHITKRRRIRLVTPLLKRVFTYPNRIQVISHYLGRFAESMGGTNISVIPNGVDTELFQGKVSANETEAMRSHFNSGQKDVYLITTSRLVHKNGVRDLIESLSFLPRNVKCFIAGDGPLRDELIAFTKTKELEERVFFLGSLTHKQLLPYLALSRVFIRPSLSEGFGISFIEAMAARLPVIATPVGGIPDFLENGKTGWFCEIHNPKSIAHLVSYIINSRNSETVNEVVERAQNMVHDKYQWSDIATQMGGLFDEEIAHARTR